jgi:hypothetical protein
MKLRIIHPAPVTERIDIIKMTMLSVSIWPPLILRLSRCSISFQVSVPRKCVCAETIIELFPVVFHKGIPHMFYINLHQGKSKAGGCDSDSNSWVLVEKGSTISHRLSLLAGCFPPSLALQALFAASRGGIPAFWHHVAAEKRTLCYCRHRTKYSISATARNVGGQVTQKSRIPKAKRRYIVSKPCATDVTPDLLDATRVGIPMWIRTALHLHHRSNPTGLPDDRGVSSHPLRWSFALRSNFPSYDWQFSATVSPWP